MCPFILRSDPQCEFDVRKVVPAFRWNGSVIYELLVRASISCHDTNRPSSFASKQVTAD